MLGVRLDVRNNQETRNFVRVVIMVEVKSYRNLKVWNRAMDLVIMCYRLTCKLPPTEVYGLISQIQRATVSITANIAEGKGRDNLGEYIYHLSIANGSLKEIINPFAHY